MNDLFDEKFDEDGVHIGVSLYRYEFGRQELELSICDGCESITLNPQYIDQLIELLQKAKKVAESETH